jgi:protein-disulfide isomerase
VRIVYKNYVVHPQQATAAALAGCAAHKQNKFFEMEAAIWERAFGTDLGEANLAKLAQEIGLDMIKYKVDFGSDACKKDIENDMRALNQVGVSATPSFFVNGRFLEGAHQLDKFKSVIDEELRKADAAIQQGVKPEDYYSAVIVGKGRKSVQ